MNYYRTVTFTPPSENITNMPLLVKIMDGGMVHRIANLNGYDVSFQDMNGNALPFELDFYDKSAGKGAWWVKIPTLYASGENQIKMLYGDDSITTNQSSPATVWSDYVGVCHFNNDVDSMPVNVVNGASATVAASHESTEISLQSNTMTGRCIQYRATQINGYILNIFPIAGLAACPGSASIYGKMVTGGGQCWMRQQSPSGNASYSFFAGSNEIEFYLAEQKTLRTDLVGDDFGYNAISRTDMSVDVDGYVNCEKLHAGNMSYWDRSNFTFTLNGFSNSVAVYQFDEVRLLNQNVSAARLLYEQQNMLKHAEFTTYGEEYYADGTLARRFYPWLTVGKIL
ncbi:MAG: DUF2341 domain-containing protein [Planctomycetia bacterium]|nr:DUF2341 domain-containing protein [Planctomycetia bacterium]